MHDVPMKPTTKKLNNANMKVRGFAAHAAEWAIWQAKADADHRTLSSWIRLRLLEADARDEELAPPLKVG